MAREVWVGPNRRALGFGMVLPALALAIGIGLIVGAESAWWRTMGTALGTMAGIAMMLFAREWRRPRVAYRPGFVEFYLRTGAPLAVPLQFVEAFFLGEGPTILPAKLNLHCETVTLVARLSRRAEAWSHVEVKRQLGRWCDGYVTIRGTWCEPLTVQLVERLNRRLYEVTREEAPETFS